MKWFLLLFFVLSFGVVQANHDTTPAVSLTVDGGSNLPFNGDHTKITVGFAGGPIPQQVTLARDGKPPFAMWPMDGSFFTLSQDRNSLVGTWCISSNCWGGVGGSHILTLTATYVGGLIFTVSIPLNVSDGLPTTDPVTAGAGPNFPATIIWDGYHWIPVFRVYP